MIISNRPEETVEILSDQINNLRTELVEANKGREALRVSNNALQKQLAELRAQESLELSHPQAQILISASVKQMHNKYNMAQWISQEVANKIEADLKSRGLIDKDGYPTLAGQVLFAKYIAREDEIIARQKNPYKVW